MILSFIAYIDYEMVRLNYQYKNSTTMIIETKRLKLIPLHREQLSLLLKGIPDLEKKMNLVPSGEVLDEHLKQAIAQMYEGVSKHPQNYLWYTNWQIILKSGNRSIGSCGFKSPPDEAGCVEIGYGINKNYRNQGFMTETLKAICNWALSQSDVKYIIAETDKDNLASQKVLQNCTMRLYRETDFSLWWKTDIKPKIESIIIRYETQKDYSEICSLIKSAFETADVKDGDEQDFAVGLRNSERYIPELAFVAEQEGKLIGHVMLTKTFVRQSTDKTFQALLVAPLSVLLEYRNRGVGSALMNEGFRIAKEMGYKAVFLCGNPDYYTRFGFVSSMHYGIKNVNGVPDQYCLACELSPAALEGISGDIDCV